VFSERTLEEGKIAGAAIVSSGQKLIVDYTDGQRTLQLYDLKGDPGETRDLAAQDGVEAQRLDGELSRALNADGSSMATWESGDGQQLPDDQVDALRELGYVE
jgi:hypothetical protein